MNSIAKNDQQSLKQWAHDVRSPLLSLEVRKRTFKDMPAEHKTLMNLAIDRIRSMTQEILYPTTQALQSVTQIAPSIDRVVSLKWLEVAHRPGLTLNVNLGVDARKAQTTLSSTVLERILSNLINNAIESIGNTGTVSISLLMHATNAFILIEDNGSGMNPETLRAIQSENILSFKKSGHGLGLAYTKTELQKIGGSLEITSREGQGTRIKLQLPLPSSNRVN